MALATPTRSAAAGSGERLFDDNFLETLEYLHIIARKILSGQLKAERKSRKKGISIEFADHRPYSPGDDFRFIDWGVFFRTDQLFIKLFEEEEDLHVYILLDCSRSMAFGAPDKFIYARRLAAAIAYLGLASLDRVFVIPFSTDIPPSAANTFRARGKGKVFSLLQFLENANAIGETNVSSYLQTFSARRQKRGLAIVISDLYDKAGITDGLNALVYQKFEPYVIQVVSPQEAAPELLGDVRLLDGESDRFRDVTLTERMLRNYREAFDGFCATTEKYCRSKQIGYMRCMTSLPFQDAVVHMLRRGRLFQ